MLNLLSYLETFQSVAGNMYGRASFVLMQSFAWLTFPPLVGASQDMYIFWVFVAMVSSVAYNSKIPLKIQLIVEFLMLIREMDDTQ